MASGASCQVPRTTLPLNTMTPYLRAHIDVTDEILRWDSWWTVLGFIPVRRERLTLPVADVADTRSRPWVHWDRLVVGVALIAAIPLGQRAWAAVLMLGVAVLLLVMAPTAQLRVTGTDGRRHRLPVCILHKFDVDLIAAALDDLTGHRGRPRSASRARRAHPPTTGPLTP